MQPLNAEACARFSSKLRREARSALDAAWPALGHPASPLGGRPMRVAHLGCASGDVTSARNCRDRRLGKYGNEYVGHGDSKWIAGQGDVAVARHQWGEILIGVGAIKVLAPRYPETVQIIGSDPDAAMVEHALVHQRDNPGLFYTCADIEGRDRKQTTLWKLKPYSHIFSFNYIKSILPGSVSLAAVENLLAPGGTAVFTILVSPIHIIYKMLAISDEYRQYMEDVEKYVPPCNLSEENYRSYLRNFVHMGLDVLGTKFDSSQYFAFNSEEELTDYLTAIDPFVHRMPEEMRGDYMQEVLRMCRSFCGVTASQETGRHCFHFSRMTLVIRRRWWWFLLESAEDQNSSDSVSTTDKV